MESGNGFSGVVRISNVSDFIAPSTACIIPLNQNTRTLKIEDSPLVAIQKRKAQPVDTASKKVVKVTLNDCLACSGCITSAETVLVDSQSLKSMLEGLLKARLSVVTVSPQSVCSIAVKYSWTVPETARRIASYFFSKGVKFVIDSSIGRMFALRSEVEKFEQKSDGPLLSSICPGFVCYAEKSQGALLVPTLSSTRSPQAILGAIVKRYLSKKINVPAGDIYHATVMPCYDKKLEASRSDFITAEGVHEVDCVISTGELDSALSEQFELVESTEPGWLGDFSRGILQSHEGGSSGGYAAAVIRAVLRKQPDMSTAVTNPQKNLEVTKLRSSEKTVTVAKVYGFKNIQNLVRKMKTKKCEYDYVEVMACPGGCGNGGGQLRAETETERENIRLQVEDTYALMPATNSDERILKEITEGWAAFDPNWASFLQTAFRPITASSVKIDF